MPIYTYYCNECTTKEGPFRFERMVHIEDRDVQHCGNGHKLERKLDFNGAVYAPTSTGGGMKR